MNAIYRSVNKDFLNARKKLVENDATSTEMKVVRDSYNDNYEFMQILKTGKTTTGFKVC